MKNVVSRVLNTKKYSDEKRDFRKKKHNTEKKNIEKVLNNIISRVYCIRLYMFKRPCQGCVQTSCQGIVTKSAVLFRLLLVI